MGKTLQIRTELFSSDLVDQYQYWLLAIVVCISAGLRFYKLGDWSLWGDEMITVTRAPRLFDAGFDFAAVSLMLTNLALESLGISEWSARLVPALLGIITIPVFYILTRYIFDSSIALLAALLLAVSPWHLYWSQNARFYTALLLFYTIALFAFFLGLEKDRPLLFLISLMFFGLAMAERMVAAILLIVLGLYVILVKVLRFDQPPGFKVRNFAIFILPAIPFALYYIILFIQEPSLYSRFFAWIDNWVNSNPLWILAGVVYYVGIPTLAMGAIGALYLLRRMDRAALLLAIAAVVPLFLIVVLSTFLYTANRYVFISLTSWVILAGVAAKELVLKTSGDTKLLAAGAIVILLLTPLSEDVLYFRYQHGNRDNWKAAYSFVKDRKKPGDLIVAANPRLGNFYMGESTIGMASLKPEDLESVEQRIWFVEDLNVTQKWPWVYEWINENAVLMANYDNHVQARNFLMRVHLYDPGRSQVFDR